MLTTILGFLASAAVIYIACGYFVNGIEWAGRKTGISETATGTILAAFGTALPEAAVTFVAVTFGDASQKDIGVGAALGGPLVLATISYAVVGFMLWRCAKKLNRNSHHLQTDQQRLSRDQAWFMLIFIVKLALGLVTFTYKPWCGVVFLSAYAAYVWREMLSTTSVAEEKAELEPLSLCPRRAVPPFSLVLLQTLAALCVIGIASHLFVGQVEAIGTGFGLAPQLVALLLSPVATELPETMNAIIWVRQGKERLALANISGAMMIQATVPSALGLFFTPWLLTPPLLLAGAITTLSIAILWHMFRRAKVSACQLMTVGCSYLLFILILVVMER